MERFIRLSAQQGLLIAGLLVGTACSEAEKRTLQSESGRTSRTVNTGNSQGATDGSGVGKDPSGKVPGEGGTDPSTPPVKPDPVISEPPTTVTGLECTKPSTYNKVKFCETTVEGVAIKFVPLEGDIKPSGLAIYMHGDTAADWYKPFVVTPFVEWAKKKNVLLVLTRSTTRYDGDAESEYSYGAAQPEDARKLEKALTKIIAAYKTPSDNLLYFGTSGGPWFMSYAWIPMMAGKFPGLFALSCGGSQAWQKFAWDNKDTKLTSKIKIFYNFGDQDFLAANQENSLKHFNAAGIVTTKKVYPGAKHCAHDVYNATVAFWEANMK